MNDSHEQTNNPGREAGVTSAGPAPELVAQMAERIRDVRDRIAAAASRAGRQPEDVTLVAVSKTHPVERLRAALAAGQTVLGESRIQEALPKIEALATPGSMIRWHLIGHLQTNKVQQAVGRFELIHSVDSARLIAALEERAARLGLVQPILLEVNVAGETSKSGAAPEELPRLLEALAEATHLRAEGLMTIPPYEEDPAASRPYFARLRELLQSLPPAPQWTPRHLSMGMSGDFEVAIEEGATLVRVGTAIFGSRD
jgi:PLP dependent protein